MRILPHHHHHFENSFRKQSAEKAAMVIKAGIRRLHCQDLRCETRPFPGGSNRFKKKCIINKQI